MPNAVLTSVTIAGVEGEGGQAADWGLQTTVWCADPLPGLERVAATSASDSASVKAIFATCPTGKRVVGVGGEITGGGGQVILDDVVPGGILTKAEAKGVEDQNGFSGSWSVTAYAICANPPAGLERAKETTNLDSTDKELGFPRVACPNNKTSIAIGSTINAGIGQVRRGAINFGARGGPADFDISLSASEDADGFSQPWSMDLMLICATP